MTENLKEEIPVFNNRIFSGRDVLEITLWADVGVIETLNIVKSIEIQQQRGEPQIVRRWDGAAIEELLTRAEQVLHHAGACLMDLADRAEVPQHQIENNVAACASAMAAIRSHVNT